MNRLCQADLFFDSDPNTDGPVDNREKTENFGVNAGVGYFIVDHLAVSISAAYEYNYSKMKIFLDPVYKESIQKTIAFIPSLTYFIPVEGNLRPSISFGVGYVDLKERNNQTSTAENIVYHYGGASVNAGAGLSYFLIKSISVDLGFQYSHNKLKDKTDKNRSQIQNNYGVIAGLSFYF